MRTVAPSTVEFLRWVDARERTYADAVEVWQTSCPRLSAWEDALAGGLVSVVAGPSLAASAVVVSPPGRAVLDGAD